MTKTQQQEPGRSAPEAGTAGASMRLAGHDPDYLQALLDGDLRACTTIVDAARAAGAPVVAIYQELMQPALYRVGELWGENTISVAREHIATATSEGVLNHLYPAVVNPQRRGRTALLATAEDELHQVGLLMVAAVFEMHGWDTVYPGAGVGVQTLTERIDAEGPDLIGLSLTVGFHGPRLQAMLARLRVHHPTLPIPIGGQGLRAVGAQISADLERVQFIDSLAGLGAYLEREWPSSPG